jgi:hypothetical protein
MFTVIDEALSGIARPHLLNSKFDSAIPQLIWCLPVLTFV